jgi:hypothetical protein
VKEILKTILTHWLREVLMFGLVILIMILTSCGRAEGKPGKDGKDGRDGTKGDKGDPGVPEPEDEGPEPAPEPEETNPPAPHVLIIVVGDTHFLCKPKEGK